MLECRAFLASNVRLVPFSKSQRMTELGSSSIPSASESFETAMLIRVPCVIGAALVNRRKCLPVFASQTIIEYSFVWPFSLLLGLKAIKRRPSGVKNRAEQLSGCRTKRCGLGSSLTFLPAVSSQASIARSFPGVEPARPPRRRLPSGEIAKQAYTSLSGTFGPAGIIPIRMPEPKRDGGGFAFSSVNSQIA